MNFNTRLLAGAVAPAVLFVAALVTALWGQTRTAGDFERYLQTEQTVANGLSEMYAQGLQMGQALRNIVLDPANRKAYENFEAAEKAYGGAYDRTLAAARGTGLEDPLRGLPPLRATQREQQQKVLALVATDPAAAAKALNSAETPAWRALRARLLEHIEDGRRMSEAAYQATAQRARNVAWGVAALALLAVAVSIGQLLLMRRTVARELGGDPEVAREALRRIADGHLDAPPSAGGPAAGLMGELERTRQRLRELVAQVHRSTDGIHTASGEIAAGNHDLSARTEQTAASLQQAASSMEQLTATVRQSAESARVADQLVGAAAGTARRGGEVVADVVSTMQRIHTDSRRIADIIGVIDGIAFQTNILALNAAVEAARAGEQGRGFAVVAGEVRNLAQRSAQAAREIKGLIGSSVDGVENGARLVEAAGQTMQEIVASVQRVSDIIGEISAASTEQSKGIGLVNDTVAELDRMTQQNAALVEQSAAAASSLKQQADGLAAQVGQFRVGA